MYWKSGMNNKAAVFEKTYQDYLSRLKGLDLSKVSARLGLNRSGDQVLIPFLGTVYRVSSAGVFSPEGQQAGFTQSVVMFKYIMMCPENETLDSQWVAYHSFKDALPLLGYFAREATGPIEDCFSGRVTPLEAAGKKRGGSVVTDTAAYDLSMTFEVLPKIPLFLRFNDMDKDFPAQCTILFKSSAELYLDMESLGMLGTLFTKDLIAGA